MKSFNAFGRVFFSCALLVALASCAPLGNTQLQAQPLIGKVWDVPAQRYVDPVAVIERAAAARFVLLGEIHDNGEHHRIQARILQEMVKQGRRPALVMEQYDQDQQTKINAILAGDLSENGKFAGLAELMHKSWDWPAYAPLVRFAVQQKLPVMAANLSRTELREVSRNGFDVLGAGKETQLGLNAVWNAERQRQLIDDIYQGHCGKITGHVVEAIAKAQRARDAVMADTLLAFKASGAVAILGRGHVRRDTAIPLYLAARAPDAPVLALGIVEVELASEPAAYARGKLGELYDYVWFTARASRQSNPCDSIPAPTKPVIRGALKQILAHQRAQVAVQHRLRAARTELRPA